MKTSRKLLIMAIIFSLLFIGFTLAVMKIDVKSAGEGFGKIGFAGINLPFRDAIGVNDAFYITSKILGCFSFGYAVFAAFVGLYQLITRKSFLKVDGEIYAIGVMYALCIFFYFLFDNAAVNMRPVLENGELESSYPSSHTLLSVCVCVSAVIMAQKYVKSPGFKKIFCIFSGLFALAVVITRLLSGYHWLTDIVGCIPLACALSCFCLCGIELMREKKTN